MARFTQYIGLSPASLEFLAKHKHKEIGKYHMTEGIAYESVVGTIYEITIESNDWPCDDIRTYAEIEDVTPWSSGPMIHTCLRDIRTGEKCFLWKEDEIHWD